MPRINELIEEVRRAVWVCYTRNMNFFYIFLSVLLALVILGILL